MTNKLAELNEDLKGLREQRADAMKRLDEAVDAGVKGDDGTIAYTPEQHEAATKAAAEAKSLREQIEATQALVTEIEWGKGPAAGSISVELAAKLAQQGLHVMSGTPAKALAAAFVEDDSFQAMLKSGGGKMDAPFVPSPEQWKSWFSQVSRKDIYSDLPSGTPGAFGQVQRDPVVPMGRRSVRVRDLFQASPTNAALIEYFRMTARNFAASTVGERTTANDGFALKPLSSFTFKGAQAAVRTIAHAEAVHRNTLRNEPVLQDLINTELLYGLQLEEDHQILFGSGSDNDLLGIQRDPDIQKSTWSSGVHLDNKADAIRRGATKAFLSGYEPSGVVVHPNDWEDMELAKDANGQYLLAVAIAVGAEKRVWRMNVVDTPAEMDGYGLVGAFGLGAKLYDAEQGSIRVADQHEDFFLRNALVVLAEEALALAVKRPDSFVEVHFDAAPA